MRILVDYRPALRERTGVGEYVHELAKALAEQAERDRTTRSRSSPAPGRTGRPRRSHPRCHPCASSTSGSRFARWSGRGIGSNGRRSSGSPASHDVVHSQSPLLIPATRAAQVVTVHDLDFLRHPDQMTAEIRRDYPALARSHAARAHA